MCFLFIYSASLFSANQLSASAVEFLHPGRFSADRVMSLSKAHNHICLVNFISCVLVLAMRLMQATAVVLSSFSLMCVLLLSTQNAWSMKNAARSSLMLICNFASSEDHWPLVVRWSSIIPPHPRLLASDAMNCSGLGTCTCRDVYGHVFATKL